jgi:hypothetical protein
MGASCRRRRFRGAIGVNERSSPVRTESEASSDMSSPVGITPAETRRTRRLEDGGRTNVVVNMVVS